MNVCFTGHRKIAGQYYNYSEPTAKWLRLSDSLVQVIDSYIASGTNTFISGLAIGLDQLAAAAVHYCRCSNPSASEIRLIGAKPFPSQASKWPLSTQTHYREIAAMCDQVWVISPDPFSPEKMRIRNRWMVDRSHHVIAVWDGKPSGGTYHTYQYAKQTGRTVLVINPLTLEMRAEPGMEYPLI